MPGGGGGSASNSRARAAIWPKASGVPMWNYARSNTYPRSNRGLPHPQFERACLARLRQQGVVIFRTGWFQGSRNWRNSANRISTPRELSRTLASIHILLAPWSCSLRKTDRGEFCGLVSLRSTHRVTAADRSSRRGALRASLTRHNAVNRQRSAKGAPETQSAGVVSARYVRRAQRQHGASSAGRSC